jgi:mono/diheme cytochrome c family protein
MQANVVRAATLLVSALVSACGGSPVDEYLQDPEALQRGKSLFIGTCAGYCHSARPGNRDAPYLFDCTWLHGGSDEEVFASIANGVPTTRMVGFGGKLPEGDDDIWRLVAFLKTQRPDC